MKHLYLFTLEIVPLAVGEVYDELPSHLTLMSRFLSDLSPEALSDAVRKTFADTAPIHLVFGGTVELGPKNVSVHTVNSLDEMRLHKRLLETLGAIGAEYQYPEFIGDNHKAHVTQRANASFEPGRELIISTAYLIEVVDKKRVIRAKFELDEV